MPTTKNKKTVQMQTTTMTTSSHPVPIPHVRHDEDDHHPPTTTRRNTQHPHLRVPQPSTTTTTTTTTSPTPTTTPFTWAHGSLLRAARHIPAVHHPAATAAPYPFYLIVLGTDGQEQQNNFANRPPAARGAAGHLVSDALTALLASRQYTSHIIALTAGHNVTIESAIPALRAAFASLQNSPALQQLARNHKNNNHNNQFSPIFVAFAWQGIPRSFFKMHDPVARATLIRQCEHANLPIVHAIKAARQVVAGRLPDSAKYQYALRNLCPQDTCTACNEEALSHVPTRFDRGFGDSKLAKVFGPLELAICRHYEARGRAVGRTCQEILRRFQRACPNAKLCLLSSSLGAHVFGQALSFDAYFNEPDHAQGLIRKAHCAVFLHGAAGTDDFSDGGLYATARNAVAGPAVMISTSSNNVLNVYDMYHPNGLIGKHPVPCACDIDPVRVPAVENPSPRAFKCFDTWCVVNMDEPCESKSSSSWITPKVADIFWATVQTAVTDDEYLIDHSATQPSTLLSDSVVTESLSRTSALSFGSIWRGVSRKRLK